MLKENVSDKEKVIVPESEYTLGSTHSAYLFTTQLPLVTHYHQDSHISVLLEMILQWKIFKNLKLNKGCPYLMLFRLFCQMICTYPCLFSSKYISVYN